MSFLKNKKVLILGLLSDRSIAYGIASSMKKQGAELAFTYQMEKHQTRVEKLAKKISDEQKKNNKKPKIFIQINIGNELQKSGIRKKEIKFFYNYCKELGLDVIGTMCLPPNDNKPEIYFSEMKRLNQELGLNEISMGMSDDYLIALKYHSTFLRIGSKIFGQRV